jgi:protoheme IX farnesyltransferase
MKFSYATSFARLTLFVLAAVIILVIGGRVVASAGDPMSCAGWPLCLPAGATGWGQLFHRFSAVFASIFMLALLFEAWRIHRDHHVLLPLTTVTVTLFFAQAYTGALLTLRGFPEPLHILHVITASALWVALTGLVLAAGLLSRAPSVGFPPFNFRQRMLDFIALTKPIIVLLLLVTTYAGLVVGGKGFPSAALTFWTLLGGALAAGGSGALNQYIDRNLDQFMQRTAKRPLAAGRMTAAEGLSFGLAACIIGIYIHAGFVNFLAAALSLAGILYYVILYSIYLKKATVQNIVIGGGAGAIPPMVGWAAATGSLSIPAWMLFAIVFFWTPPHFWALAIVRAKDYELAGVPMLPVVRGEKETRWQIFIYTIGLVALTLAMPLFGFAGNIYLVLAGLFGGGLIYAAWRVYRIQGNKVAWQMYRYSSMYLAFIFIALMIDAVM